jgi:hypothetical protein
LLTLREYAILELAMFEKECENLALLRQVRTDIVNFSGMGATKRHSEKDIMSIPMIDNQYIITPIKNIEQALTLLKQFE